MSHSDDHNERDDESETSLQESSDEILELDEQVDDRDSESTEDDRDTAPMKQPTTDRIHALDEQSDAPAGDADEDEDVDEPTDESSGGQDSADQTPQPDEEAPSAAVVNPSTQGGPAVSSSEGPAEPEGEATSGDGEPGDERTTDELDEMPDEPGDIESVSDHTGVSGESISEVEEQQAGGAASGLHETIQMEALDRAAIEREGQFRELEQTQPVLDNRMAPEIVAAPPTHRVNNWRSLKDVLDEIESPASVGSSPGASESSGQPDQGEGTGRARRPTPAARPAASAAAENPGSGGPPPTEGLDDGSRDSERTESLADAISDATGGESRRPVDPTSDTAPAPAEAVDPAAAPQTPDVPSQQAQSLEVPDWIEKAFGENYLLTVSSDVQRRTARQVDFIEESLELAESDRVLDLACGFGRHTIELASRGYQVVGFDLSKPLLERAVKEANRNSLQVNFIHGDMRALQFENVFNACFCWQTSFGYFDDDTNLNILRRLHRALQPGGELLLQVVNRDYVVEDMPHRLWWEGTECVFLEEGEFDPESSTMHLERSFIYEDGRQPLEHDYIIRVYSLHELKRMCRKAGFEPLEVSGAVHYRGDFLGADSPHIIIRAAAT